jgi:hypothetical protein
MIITNCGYCHECMTPLRIVLGGADWCRKCQTYRRYNSHGWTRGDIPDNGVPCVMRTQVEQRGVVGYNGPDA